MSDLINLNLLKSLKENILKADKENTGYLAKSFFNIPLEWDDLLNLVYLQSNIKSKKLEDQITSHGSPFESVVGSVVVIDGMYYSVPADNENFYNNILYNKTTKLLEEIKKETEFLFGFGALKISLGNKITPSHADNWDAINLQIKGKTIWKLSDTENGDGPIFVSEPGDLLYFRQGIFHEVFSEGPRANIICNIDESTKKKTENNNA